MSSSTRIPKRKNSTSSTSDEEHPAAHKKLISLTRTVSPPPTRRRKVESATKAESSSAATTSSLIDLTASDDEDATIKPTSARNAELAAVSTPIPNVPFTLTHITSLPASANTGATTLHSLIGSPLLRELWVFNYCINLPFIMSQLDPDIRHAVKVYIVHGSWKRESQQRILLEEQKQAYPNVTIRIAYMPEPFGTHHSKILCMRWADERAEVVIHTANMIPFDWENMTQAAWRSGPLERLAQGKKDEDEEGVGQVFKGDLLAYFSAYGQSRTDELVKMLREHDFSHIKAIFVGSVPSRDSDRRWGWSKLKDSLLKVSCAGSGTKKGHIVIQVSSIASIPDTWFKQTLLGALRTHRGLSSAQPTFSVVFPTAPEIRSSLNGYRSGTSVHTKIGTAAQKKQAENLRKHFCGWASGLDSTKDETIVPGGRSLAAPHIKTYIRFANGPSETSSRRLQGKPDDYKDIEWALVTSANLSTQAWGAAETAMGEIRICSWEAGVLVHPGLWGKDCKMKAYYANQKPSDDPSIISIRVPYDVPLRRYSDGEMPWSPGETYMEEDVFGEPYVC